MEDKKLPESNDSCQSNPIPVRKESSSDQGYHVSSSLSRRGPLWPQTFGRQMDNKIYSCSPKSRHTLGGDAEHAGNEYNSDTITGVMADNCTDSDLREPLLKNNEKEEEASPRKGGSEDLENGSKIDGRSPRTRTSEGHLSACDVSGVCDLTYRDHPSSSGSSFLQATLNGVNVLAGVGILSTPYALSQGGWLSLGFLLAFSIVCLYTGILLRRCLDTDSAIVTYPDIGQAAFGRKGRLVVSVLLYFELYCVTVEFLILEGDNLTNLFPFSGVTLGNSRFTPHQVYVVLSALCMLPTVWLRDLRLLSYISAGGVVASLAIVSTVGYVGVLEVGFHNTGTLINPSGLPVAVGVYAFCFCGHAVFPSIYRSMKYRQDFSKVLLVCFVLVTIIYAGIGVLGYTMFGDVVESQVTLNLPREFLSSRIAIWITLVNPFAKFALTITPLAVALEEFLPWSPKSNQYVMWGSIIRGMLVASTVIVALLVPFFGYMMAFIGSFMSVSVAIILPCACYLRIFGRRGGLSSGEISMLVIILCVGFVTAFVGTYSAIMGIIGSFDVVKGTKK